MKRIGLAACAALLAGSVFAQQNVGIGTNNPQTKLQVEGAISVAPSSAAASASVTIPDNVSIFRLTLTAGGGTTALSLAAPKEGQYLTIYNQDDNAATLAGYTIAPLTGVISVNYINSAWRLVSDNQPKTLSLSTNQLSISGGNTVTFTNWDTDATNDITTATNAAGDVTGPFSNLQIAANAVGTSEIANNTVTYGKLQAATGNSKIIGSPAGSSTIGELTLGSGLSLTGSTLSAAGSGGTVTGVTGTAPIQSSGGAAPVISITQAGTSSNGYLSSTDWNTFNGKLSTEVDGIIGNEVTNATTSGGLVRAGAGTGASPYTLGIATDGVTTTHILDGTVATADVAANAIDGTKIGIGTTNGDILYYNGTDWVRLGAGTAGQVLKANGVAAPSWGTDNAGTGTVTSVATGAGLTGGPVTSTGTISLANGTATGQVFVTGATPFTPALATMGGDATIASNGTLTLTANSVNTAEITNNAVDGTKIGIGTANGDILYYNGTDWVRLGAGTAGQVLKANGVAAPSWGTDNAGTGTVTSVATGAGLTGGPVTSTGTISLANGTAAGQVFVTGATPFTPALATMGGDATMASNGTLTLTANSVNTAEITNNAVDGTKIGIGTTAGDILYYNGTDWVRLGAGTTGQVLKANGAAAPSWGTDNAGTGTVTGVTATAPVVSSGGTAPVISMAAASASVNGYLTSTDWTTFNNKLSAEVDGIIGNEVTNATVSGGLVRAGAGTGASPYTLGIASNGVVTAHVAANAIDGTKIGIGTTAGDLLYYDGTDWQRLAAGPSGTYLRSNGAAAPSWNTVTGTADNLGNHTATTTLNMSSNAINNSGAITFSGAGVINSSGSDHIEYMSNVRADDNSYEWHGFYSGTARQGIILYDGQWSGANNITNEFSLTAENNNKLTLNTTNGDVALMPKGGKTGVNTLSPGSTLHVNGSIQGKVRVMGNANFTMDGDDYCIINATTLTANRTLTLPPLTAGVTDGKTIHVMNAATSGSGIVIAAAAGNSLRMCGNYSNPLTVVEGIILIAYGTTWYQTAWAY